MKKILFEIMIPLTILALWMLVCYYPCNKVEGFDFVLYWIMVGFPYGIKRMYLFLVPKKFSFTFGIGILAIKCIIAGLIGGLFVVIRVLYIFGGIINLGNREVL